MEPITVRTPGGIGQVWGIDRGKVIVKMDWQYLVGFKPEEVEHVGRDE